jgi:hypothetical protein
MSVDGEHSVTHWINVRTVRRRCESALVKLRLELKDADEPGGRS